MYFEWRGEKEKKARLSAGSIKQARQGETESQTAAKTPPLSLHASHLWRIGRKTFFGSTK